MWAMGLSHFPFQAKNIVQKIMEHDMPEFSGGGSRSGTFDRGGSFEVERKASTLDSTRISSSSSIDPTISKSLTIAREVSMSSNLAGTMC